MAWPPAVLPTNRTNATPQLDTHPSDHNNVNAAVNDIVAYIQATRRTYGNTTTIATDAFGNAVLTTAHGIPAGAKVRGGVAVGAQRDYPAICIVNNVDIPLGSAAIAFKVMNPGGTPVTNNTISISWLIVYDI